jgi:hypothetical protein
MANLSNEQGTDGLPPFGERGGSASKSAIIVRQ